MLSTNCLEAIAIDKDNLSDSNGSLCQNHTCPERSLKIEQFTFPIIVLFSCILQINNDYIIS